MTTRRWAVTITMTVVSLAACGGSDDSDIATTEQAETTTTIDLADGALIRNEGVTLDGDGVPVTTATTIAAATDTATAGDDGTPADADNGAGAPTTLADGTVPDAQTTVTTAAGVGTDGSESDGADSGTGAGSSDGTGGGGNGTAEPGTGLLVIDSVSYPFDVEFCEIADDAIEISGGGIASDGAGFEASIFYEGADIDGDGAEDSVLEVAVVVDVAPGADGDSVPDFSAFDITTSASGADGVLTFEITSSGISGTGVIEDLNGVAFPADRPAPMTFDVTCA